MWVAASNLVAGDALLMEDGRSVYVKEVRIEKLDESIKVYNLEIDELHTYFVAGGVLVHNGCKIDNNKKYDDNQQAVIQLAKEAKKNGGILIGDAYILLEFAEEYDVPYHGPEMHPDRPGAASNVLHIHVGKTGHKK